MATTTSNISLTKPELADATKIREDFNDNMDIIDGRFSAVYMAIQAKNAVSITGGSITGITDLAIADGGTASSTAANARTALGAAASGANADITSLTALTQLNLSTETTGTYDIILKANQADALSIKDSAADMIVFDTTTGSHAITFTPEVFFNNSVGVAADKHIIFGTYADWDGAIGWSESSQEIQLMIEGNLFFSVDSFEIKIFEAAGNFDIKLCNAWAGGVIFNVYFDDPSTVLSADAIGMLLDFNSYITMATDKDVIVYQAKVPGITQSAANTTLITGFDLPLAGALVQDTLEGTITWKGLNFQLPNTTQTTGTVNAYGIHLTPGTITSGTQIGIKLDGTFTTGIEMGANNLTMTGSIADTTNRVTKGWFDDIESTNDITVGGIALASIYAAIAQTMYIGTTQVAINRSSAALTLAGITLTTPVLGMASGSTIDLAYTNEAAGGDYGFQSHIKQETNALTGTLLGAYITASNNQAAASSGIIRGLEVKARTKYPGGTGGTVAVLEGVSISADSKDQSVTTMRGIEVMLDGSVGGTVTEGVGIRIANNMQADKITTMTALQIYSDSFAYDYGIDMSQGAGGITTDIKLSKGETISNNVDGIIDIEGEVDFNAHSVGFTIQTLTGDGTDDIDWKLGNYMMFTCPSGDETFTFTAPSNPCALTLQIKQDNVGGRDITLPASVKWLGTEPTWSNGGADKTIIMCMRYDGTNYWSQCTSWEA